MKIGLDLRLFGTANGGIGRYCKELFPRILEMDLANTYYLFINNNTIDQEDLNKLKSYSNTVLVESNYRHYSLSEQISFLRLLNKYELDLVHFPNFNVPIFYNRPFVVTIHDMVHHKISGAKRTHRLHFYAYKKVIENAAKKAKAIITVSEYSKKDIIKYLQVSAEKILVTYEGASLNTNVEEEYLREIKKRYVLQNPYFLFVGVLERKKNLVNLTRGFDAFLKKYKVKMDMVIVGKVDKHYPEIKHKALDIKNSDHLIFTGYVQEKELSAFYKGAYAFISASMHEGFGLPGVEALTFGLPLLMSNMEVYNEIFDNSAIYFNPLDPDDIAEKMNILVRDNLFHEQLQQKSFERSQHFNWSITAKQTLELYKKYII